MATVQLPYRSTFFRLGDYPDAAAAFCRFRKTLFVDKLRWDLKTFGDQERDEFDDAETSCCVIYSGDDVVGGFRAIRTDRPYLAREVFPGLATLHPFPNRRDVWEISRFGVSGGSDRTSLARIAYALMFRFGYLRTATAFVAVADLTYERFLSSLGIRSARYGPPQPLAKDLDGCPMQVVAGEIRMADQSGPRFQRLLDHAHLVEIRDETLVLGRARISA